jgi:hypothetical protein
LIWERLDGGDAAVWIYQTQAEIDPAPEIFRLERPEDARERLGTVGPHTYTVRRDSGTVDVDFGGTDLVCLPTIATAAAEIIDEGRQVYRSTDLDDEERGSAPDQPRLVVYEALTSIGGLRSVGPGGRITIYDVGERRTAELSIRKRTGGVSSRWRNPTAILSASVTALAEAPPGTRLRGAFGYYEASKYERQGWLRPAFVFLLDRPSTEDGPRWRVAFVEAATDSDELAPTAGLESASGGGP